MHVLFVLCNVMKLQVINKCAKYGSRPNVARWWFGGFCGKVAHIGHMSSQIVLRLCRCAKRSPERGKDDAVEIWVVTVHCDTSQSTQCGEVVFWWLLRKSRSHRK